MEDLHFVVIFNGSRYPCSPCHFTTENNVIWPELDVTESAELLLERLCRMTGQYKYLPLNLPKSEGLDWVGRLGGQKARYY